jgi:NAD(P)H-flavin reductase
MIRTQILELKTDKAKYAHLRVVRPAGFDYLPGQYVALAANEAEKPKYLAMASHPSESQLLYVGHDFPYAPGEVIISPAQGAGFKCDYASHEPFLFLAHGTGITAIRAAILERQQRGMKRDTLLYGIQTAADEPELDCLHADFALRQERAFSAEGDKKHVQDVLRTMPVSHYAAVLLIGSNDMMADCRAILAEKGFPPEMIFSNY